MTVSVVRVTSDDELAGILSLHHENLLKNLTEEVKQREGYVTAEYDMELLKLMHSISPAVIAKDGDQVVGYVLVVTKGFYGKHALMDDLMNCVDKIAFQGEELKDVNYALCGQLCVGKNHRGLGLVQQMYDLFRQDLKAEYKYCVTDVAEGNPRSLKAHVKTGFQVIERIEYDGVRFDVILWDWCH